eukprot:c7308_g2_i2.p1 GENE.c7308_g2_i2~~c7308_g2_i2.p1  ORF type:complete len:113 (-),score=12.44 c7308_g2_i2:57-395(-)
MQQRDIIFNQRHHINSDGAHFVMLSPMQMKVWDKHPIQVGIVRAKMDRTGGFIIRPLSATSCDVIFVNCVTLGGCVPHFVANRLTRMYGKLVTRVRRHFENSNTFSSETSYS